MPCSIGTADLAPRHDLDAAAELGAWNQVTNQPGDSGVCTCKGVEHTAMNR